MDSERSAAFEALRPLCVNLTKTNTRENVCKLSSELKTIKGGLLQELQEYVIFPLRFIFRQQLQTEHFNEDLLTEACNCLNYILVSTSVAHWEMFQDIFTSLSCLLSSPSGQKKEISSEELKMALVKTFGNLLKGTDPSVLRDLFSPASLPPMGHLVSVLLKMIQNEKSRDIQLACLDCLLCLSQVDAKCGKKVKVVHGNIFASFLPGITMSLCRVVTGDTKQGQAVLSRALEVWWKVTCLVMADEFLKKAQGTESTARSPDSVSKKIQGLMVMRSADWVKMTGTKLAVLVKQIAATRSHSNWRVRLALVEWAEQLLHQCAGSLQESVPLLLEVLVGMIGDEYPNVSARSKKALEEYETSNAESDKLRPLTEVLEENLHALATALPRQIRVIDEDQKLGTVSLLCGYLTLLGPRVNCLLRSLPHLRRLSLALVQAVELDCRDIKIIERRTGVPGCSLITAQHSVERPRKTFKHFRDTRIEDSLMQACQLLGHHGDLHVLVDHFLDLFNESSVYKMSATLILNEVVAGCRPEGFAETSLEVEQSEVCNIVRMISKEYLSPKNFGVRTKSDNPLPVESSQSQIVLQASSSCHSVNIKDLNENITQLALYLEGLGKFSLVLGAQFKALLLLVLYPVLEKLGDENAVISSSAYWALTDMCQACGYRSLDELIRLNADYLMNAISLRLRHLEMNPKTPQVLQVILQYCEADILPLIRDTVDEILSCLDDHYADEACMFMKVLYELACAVNRWFPSSRETEAPPKAAAKDDVDETGDAEETRTVSSLEDISQYFLDYHRQKLISEGHVSEEDLKDVEVEAEGMNTDPHKQSELPQHVTALKEVLTRTKHLLSSSNPRLRLLVLDIIAEASTALGPWKNELLPLIHQLWQPFVFRFSDEEKLVNVRALKTLCTLCQVSGDFLRQRIFKDIIPKLVSFLQTQAKISAGSAPAYLYTVNSKLQLAALESIGKISCMTGAEDLEVDAASMGCLPYLSCRQPRTLQEAAVQSMEQLIRLEPDALWLKLCNLYMPSELSPPSAEFLKVKFQCQPGRKNEYTRNVNKILASTCERLS